MKQRRQKLHFDNLDELLKSSPTVKRKGAQQFETPSEVAEALCLPLPARRETIADLQCGHGALLRAAAITAPAGDTRMLLGVDIDPTASIPAFPAQFHVTSEVIVGDITKIAPLMPAVNLRFDLLVLNPPFSLRWPKLMVERTASPLVDGKAAAHQPSTINHQLMDSTVATLEMAHELLTKRGEGMMICSASTATRLLEPHSLWKKTWLRLTLPNFFPGVVQKMEIAVLYFAAGHQGTGPLELRARDTMPDTIRRTLEYAVVNRNRLIAGETVKQAHDACGTTANRFAAVTQEWKRLTGAAASGRDGWNIRLTGQGTITSYLTPFQTLTGEVPKLLVEALAKVDGQHPTALVVQRATRKALLLATSSGIWRVHPDVAAAVALAMQNYNAVRAPLRPLNTVQRLGHLDEEDEIRCEAQVGSYPHFTPGRSYPLESETFLGKKIEKRPHWKRAEKGEKEEVLVTGQELLLRIKDDAGQWHAFTQYDLGPKQQSERPETYFHLLSELIECFHIPEVPDIAAVHPEKFAMYQGRLRALEWEG